MHSLFGYIVAVVIVLCVIGVLFSFLSFAQAYDVNETRCNNCKEEISERTHYTVSFFSDYSGLYPSLNRKDYDFCTKECILKWLKEEKDEEVRCKVCDKKISVGHYALSYYYCEQCFNVESR